VREIVAGARGFIYVVARLGVTGTATGPADDLDATVARVRAATDLPVAVGFGIATADQARQVARLADGVVVGSALVDRLEREGPAGAERFLRGLRVALDEGVA
jgi:tryptophan synthase alpha chain